MNWLKLIAVAVAASVVTLVVKNKPDAYGHAANMVKDAVNSFRKDTKTIDVEPTK